MEIIVITHYNIKSAMLVFFVVFCFCFFRAHYVQIKQYYKAKYEPPHDKTNKMACAPSEDSDQPGHPPSLISLRCALNG